MANKFGSENYSMEFRDLQATTMSLDSKGQYALLAGRKYLGILDLAVSQGDLLVRVPYGGKYEISGTQWSSQNLANVLAVASSQRCDIFELTDGAELKCLYRLKCHSRVITDIDWSSQQPSLLATSSFDSYVHIWDIRVPRQAVTEKPQQSLSALDGASQVRWNKWKTETLASCDGGHVKIWDMRKPNTPSEYIAAHASKINGLEWIQSDMVITAAQDCTVKFSRLAAPVPAQAKGPCLTVTTPVWRARPAPIGRGIITQCVPILRRDSGLLNLWDWKRFSSPIYTFQAHDIVEFAWKRTDGNCDLITWSRDQILRVWSLPAEIIELCGETPTNLNRRTSIGTNPGTDYNSDEKNEDLLEEEHEFTKSDNLDSITNNSLQIKELNLEHRTIHRRKSSTPSTLMKRDELLKKEFEDAAANKHENVMFEQMEVERGILRFSWKTDPKGRSLAAVVLTSFPLNYPATAPTFLVTSSGIDVDKNQILKNLKYTAQQYARKKEPCLSACIQQFANFMNLIKPEVPYDFSAFPSRGVSNVPFPRTSGARFCSVGMLICFGRPSYLRRVKLNCDAGTPRSLSALGPFLSQLAHDNDEITLRRRSRRGERKRAGLVTIFDVCHLLPFSRELASMYNHFSELPQRKALCMENEKRALSLNFTRVGHAWQAATIVAKYAATTGGLLGTKKSENHMTHSLNSNDMSEDEEDANWIHFHPLGSKFINSIIQHYASYGDVQTAASIACIFTPPQTTQTGSGSCGNGSNPGSMNYISNGGQTNGYAVNGDFPNRNGRSSTGLKQPGVGSPYHTVHGSDTLHGVVVNPLSDSFFRQHRSNSWSDSLDDSKAIQSIHETALHNGGSGQGSMSAISGANNGSGPHSLNNISPRSGNGGGGGGTGKNSILDPKFNHVYDCYKKSYAEILYRWGYLQQRSEVLKCLTEGVDSSFLKKQGVDFVMQCKICDESVRGPYCPKCRKVVSFCAICHTPAKGLCTYCITCGHGGHSDHIMQWFTTKKVCPTGCSCPCIEFMANG